MAEAGEMETLTCGCRGGVLVALPPPFPLELLVVRESTLTPSMKTSGALEREIDAAPRMLMRGAVPVVPEPVVTFTPATRPSSTCVTVETGATVVTSLALIVETTAPWAARV